MNIIAFRLLNGVDIIGEDVSKPEINVTQIVVKNPVYVVPQDAGNNRISAEFHPYAPMFEDHVIFQKDAIQAYLSPIDSLKNEYNRIFGSGIVIADASILKGK